jgi:pimeloyl-ACP methyl ester carboxylesterase
MRNTWLVCLVVLVTFVVAIDPDVSRGAAEIIAARGYPVETHEVTTSDGYILDIFRIPRLGAPVVLLLPGFTCNCMVMLLQEGNTTLPFQLYDVLEVEVWLANFRGTTYGWRHTNLTSKDAQFWQYSFDEMAKFDLPVIIAHVLATSGQEKISALIGHSEGGTIGMAALAAYPEVQNKANSFIALAPGFYIQNSISPMVLALEVIAPILKTLGVHSFVPTTSFAKSVVPELCTLVPWLCESIVCFATGCEDTGSLSQSRVPVLLAHYPDNSSVQDMDHWIVMPLDML